MRLAPEAGSNTFGEYSHFAVTASNVLEPNTYALMVAGPALLGRPAPAARGSARLKAGLRIDLNLSSTLRSTGVFQSRAMNSPSTTGYGGRGKPSAF